MLCDRLVVGVLYNPDKPAALLPLQTRLDIISESCAHLPNVTCRAFSGLLIDAARSLGADAVLRGVRSGADLESELQMARINRQIGQVETLVLISSPEHCHISSSMVRQIAVLRGPYRDMVPEPAFRAIERLLNEGGRGNNG